MVITAGSRFRVYGWDGGQPALTNQFTRRSRSGPVGFAADGRSFVTERRDVNLISGVHQLEFWPTVALPSRM